MVLFFIWFAKLAVAASWVKDAAITFRTAKEELLKHVTCTLRQEIKEW